MYAKAIVEHRKALELNADPWVKALLGHSLLKSGGRGEARRAVAQTKRAMMNKFADLIAVEGNALEDIRAMGSVVFVMKAGQVYKSPK